MNHMLSRRVFQYAGLIGISLALLLSAIVPAFSVSAQPAQQTWNLVWADEFNGSGAPNSANWNYHVGNGYNPGLPGFQGWGNGEWEWYRPENCYQSGGNLVLRADFNSAPTNIAGRDWYQRSCRITTHTKHSFQYGKIEARIQMPNANGSWPAFWMMGDACAGGSSTSNYNAPISTYDIMVNNWASCGEVDIMEHKNSETTVYNNIFWDLRTGLFPWTAGQNANYVTTYNAGNVNAFHVYAIEWTPTYIRWTFDGNQTHLIDTTPATLEEFRRPFHVILNLALGGAFPAMDPAQGQFPLYMNVDYIRHYTQGTGPVATATRTNTSVPGATATRTPTPGTGPTATRTRTPTPGTSSSQGVDNVSANQARIWYKCAGTCQYVIAHYTRPGLVQQNIQMTYNSGLARWETLVTGITAGQVLQYNFTYNIGGVQNDTAWFSWTKP